MRDRAKLSTCAAISLFLIALGGSIVTGKTIYVDADATGVNNGSSWAGAYNYLQDALMMASAGDEIRVAQGIYKPDQFVLSKRANLGRMETFQLKNGVAIRGGYAGFGEPDPNARNIEVHETILSGDLNGDDVNVPDPCDLLDEPIRAENSYHVVTGSLSDETAVLDGFTITAGNADGAHLNNSGGGMFNSKGNPSFVNCTFECNSAISLGGGFYNDSFANPKLLSCTFSRNSAGFLGGGMDIMGQATLINCIFINNFSKQAGGAINSVYSDRTVLTNCYFIANSARSNGGAAYFREAFDAILTNCTFVSNSAHNRGGGIYAHINSVHCEVINSIFWGNSNDQIFGAPYVLYSDVQDGWQGEGNIDADPVFADPNNGDYHLKSQAGRYDPNPPAADWVQDDVTSPCIDAGDPNSPINLEPFPNGGIINMGAYGGSSQASKSYFGEPVCETIVAGDINGDCRVDFRDFAIMALHWLESVEQVLCADNQDSP